MADGLLQQGALMRPPVDATETTLVAGTQSAILALVPSKGRFYSFVCDQAFNLNFSTTSGTVAEPSTAYVFAAGVVYSFAITSGIVAFRAKSGSGATLKWWISSYA